MDYRDIIIDIRRIVRAINLESRRIQGKFGVSIPQLLLMLYLKRQDQYQATHKAITTHLNLNSSTVTGIINRLEKNGLIARLPKKGDRRITFVVLTSRGFKLLQRTPHLLHDTLSENIGRLPAAQVRSIHDNLVLLTRALGIQDVDASPLLVIEDPIEPAE